MTEQGKRMVLRPGFMVALKTRITGGVTYDRRDLDASREEGAEVTRWETTKIVEDPAQLDRAVRARGEASTLIRRVCVPTAFGLLCPESRESELSAAIVQARAIVATHNAGNPLTYVGLYVLTGKIASTDEESARAIGNEVASLIDGMNRAIDKLDPKAIRKAATDALAISAMLDARQSEQVGAAVEQARKAARAITKRVLKDAEPAAQVLASLQRSAIEQARIAFLDLDAPAETSGETLPAVNLQRFADLDVDDASEASEDEDEPVKPSKASKGETETRKANGASFRYRDIMSDVSGV